MKSEESFERLSDESMRRWYEWVISRKVLLVEMFPVRLNAFADLNLAAELGFDSYCPSICLIEVEHDLVNKAYPHNSSKSSVFKESLLLFLRECIHLKGVRYIGPDFSSDIDDIVISVLRKGLNHNTLHSIYIDMRSVSSTENKLLKFLADHILSLQDCELIVSGLSEDCIDAIMNILHKNRSPLKRLVLFVDRISWQMLLVCLSSVGVHLETLDNYSRLCERRVFVNFGKILSPVKEIDIVST
eukprot:scaffold954_cov173-Ochromonas_danica.AAC.14